MRGFDALSNSVQYKFNLETVIFRPASTIGMRDRVSFFTQLYRAYQQGRFPISPSQPMAHAHQFNRHTGSGTGDGMAWRIDGSRQ